MITFVCFSKDRPLQLDAYIRSLQRYAPKDAELTVILKAEPPYLDAYLSIESTYPTVTFVHESDFYSDVVNSIGRSEYTSFGCDDVVFNKPIHAGDTSYVLSDPRILGISLRLGTSVTHGMFGNPMQTPLVQKINLSCMAWPIAEGVGDWGYPWEVLGTIYRTPFVQTVLSSLTPHSPSQLEEHGSQVWQDFTDCTLLASWDSPRMLVPTVNIVQNEFPNGFIGAKPLDPLFLLECWNQGLRVDIDRYVGLQVNSWRIGEFFMCRV